MPDSAHIWADDILARCDELATASENPTDLTRTFLTPEHARANELVAGWMIRAGMVAVIR